MTHDNEILLHLWLPNLFDPRRYRVERPRRSGTRRPNRSEINMRKGSVRPFRSAHSQNRKRIGFNRREWFLVAEDEGTHQSNDSLAARIHDPLQYQLRHQLRLVLRQWTELSQGSGQSLLSQKTQRERHYQGNRWVSRPRGGATRVTSWNNTTNAYIARTKTNIYSLPHLRKKIISCIINRK